MKKFIFILFFILLQFAGYRCNTSKSNPNQNIEVEKYVLICKTWGFLKYYHPGASNGLVDWDKNLLEILERVDSISTKKQLNDHITYLIEFCDAQKYSSIDTNYLRRDSLKSISFGWLYDTTYLSKYNSKKLLNLYLNKINYNNFYFSSNDGVGNLLFNNEKLYKDSVLPSKNLRLLSLFRYWNIINYFYPHHEINDRDWSTVLTDYIPQFICLKDTLEYHLKVLELTSEINDGHSWTNSKFITLEFGIFSLPYKLSSVENTILVQDYFGDSLGKMECLEIGDQVQKINGQDVKDLINNTKKYYPYPNIGQFYGNVLVDLIRTNSSDSISVEIIRDKRIHKCKVKPYYMFKLWELHDKDNSREMAFKVLFDSIGYINLEYLSIEEVPIVMDSLINLPKLIIDVRNYPNGVLYELSKYLNPVPTAFVKIFKPDAKKPGQFVWDTILHTGTINPDYYKGKVRLIVNEQTQSHAEFTVMCLQSAPNVKTIGSITAGTDGNMSPVYLPGDIITHFSGIGIVYPDGAQTQRVGIKIDTLVYPTIPDIIQGHDRLLSLAIEI